MTAPAVRPLLSIAAASLVLGSVAMAGAPTAFAAPGDNGDVKIHHAGGRDEPRRTPVNSETTEPRVCTFYLAAFDFEGVQQLSWTISPQRPVDSVTTNGAITIDSTGRGITPDLTLVDGAYTVEWTWEGQSSSRKSRDFRVDCDELTTAAANGDGSTGSNGSRAGDSSFDADSAGPTNGPANGPTNGPMNGDADGGEGSGSSGNSSGNGTSGNSSSDSSWSDSGSRGSSTADPSGGNWGSGSGGGSGGGGGESGGNGGSGGKPPQGPVGAGGGGSATMTTPESSDDGIVFGVASALAAGLAGTAGLILVRRARRRTHDAS